MKIGIQMFSLRTQIAEEGLEKVLEQVAKAGFDGVELAGYYGKTPTELKKNFDKFGLMVSGVHSTLGELTDSYVQAMEYATALGYKNFIIPWMPPELYNNAELFEKMVAELNNVGQKLISEGYTYGYHNHSFEFENGDGLKKLSEAVPSLRFEVDIFWLKTRRPDCLSYLENMKDKLLMLHLKELSPQGVEDFNPVVGDGILQADKIIHFASQQNHDWIILEAEKIAIPYNEYIKRSYDFMKDNAK